MSLGKGLGALITPTKNRRITKKGQLDSVAFDNNKMWQIPVKSITPDPNQPRKHFDAKELDELAQSIKEYGVLQPILVTEKADGGYEIISGERRWRASQIAGLVDMPAIVKKIPKQEKLEIALIENIQREDLNPIEEAFAYKRLMDEFNLTQQEVGDKVGKARSTIANIIRILELPNVIKEALLEKKINLGHAKVLLGLENESDQLDMLSSMMGEKITVRELERSVDKKSSKNKKTRQRDPNIVYLEDQLRSSLGTKVTINNRNGKGKIIIDFYSEKELSELVDKLTS